MGALPPLFSVFLLLDSQAGVPQCRADVRTGPLTSSYPEDRVLSSCALLMGVYCGPTGLGLCLLPLPGEPGSWLPAGPLPSCCLVLSSLPPCS